MNPDAEEQLSRGDMMETYGDAPSADGATYPEAPQNPHNHRFTISMNGQGPMVVVRGNTAEEVNAAWQELEEHATGAIMGSAWSSLKAAAMLANGLGASPAPAGPPAPPQGPPAPPVPQYPQPAQQHPGAPGTAPAPWQNAGAPTPPAPPAQGGGNGRAEPKPRPPWPQVYRISIARGDTSFKEYRAANQQYFKGKVNWAGGGDYWIHGDVVQSVAQWNPVPA